ncbi:arsenosugar biosynthesis radical SAM (seleno)protein ArsS [Beggiatoa leptomitoformis]|uniref:Radical SAM/Cys-rich domain protein n=1 Tax=Beggiatoa leptomitoformis TaxID=288004 RepID=A0A2N9YCN0_9GAMM|nr:arsenosugar biosynthesis radical SAM (seleno)protein ArsS [Beggiatoa leptomitoformis]ALG66517.1 radical SAM/Cys-rich domain protein [Beggiatoa leptomitoformis]AUI68186.1 radical SAM/Cys-rich domain protein [Beggiatoa leptomitoformis]
MLATLPHLQKTDFPAISRQELTTVQINLGYVCNQQCIHCHVNASPTRKESMTRETAEDVLRYLQASDASVLDMTGGAPELNPCFRWLVTEARQLGIKVIDRCNLTVLFEPQQTDLAAFLAEQQVEIIASLPCYSIDNVDKQRGKGTFKKSIEGLQQLNALGYGKAGSALHLHLVFNPQAASLPPPQKTLEADYKKVLSAEYNVVFNQLYTLCNMPIQRFGSALLSNGQFTTYMQLLRQAFQVENLAQVMCRQLLSIDWQGYVYDCDFNQMLGLPLLVEGKKQHIRDLLGINLNNNPIVIADHCYGCTAGQGSSCGGALS